jgi:predicted polyphosphate/ATP-dependent NAD kinase
MFIYHTNDQAKKGKVTVKRFESPKKKLGLIVNPIAGMGGKVGLKGTDTDEIVRKAKELGAQPVSPGRTIQALRELRKVKDRIELITCPGRMGEDEARECGFNVELIDSTGRHNTTSVDTKKAARRMAFLKVDLLLFAGGDGTARDICDAIDSKVPVLGIPAGVKIHSAVFATNPQNAGTLTATYLNEGSSVIYLCAAEVLDIDEREFRNGRLSARLYGYLQIPFERGFTQSAKGTTNSEADVLDEVATDVINNMEDGCLYIIGSGTIPNLIMKKLNLPKTLLGVDAICSGRLIGADLNEAQLLELTTHRRKAKIVVTVIGGQGYIFGRGNQQISGKVIRKVGKENIIVAATMDKLASLMGRPLLVDTDDNEVNHMLRGHIQVTTGLNERVIAKVA